MHIGQDRKRRHVIHPSGIVLELKYLVPIFKSQRVTIMIWGCFSGEKVGPLIKKLLESMPRRMQATGGGDIDY